MLPSRQDRARSLLLVGMVIPLVILGTFKYFDFFVDEVSRITEAVGPGAPDLALSLVLPVGISFYTFQTIGYVIDVHRGSLEPERDVLDFFLFVTFFPPLVAGPIERGTNLLPRIKTARRIGGAGLLHGSYLIAQGYAKEERIVDGVSDFISGDTATYAQSFIPVIAERIDELDLRHLVIIWPTRLKALGDPTSQDDAFVAGAVADLEARGFEVLNLHNDQRFVGIGYFAESDHLNAGGRDLVTVILAGELKAQGLAAS